MLANAIPESPTARLLLERAARAASCRIKLAGRTVYLRDGEIIDIDGERADPTLADFLVATGRLDEAGRREAERRAETRDVPIEHVLSELTDLAPEALRELRRSLLLDRLVAAISATDEAGDAPPEEPLTVAASGPAFRTVDLVLDALTRRAAFDVADAVGAARSARFAWLDGPLQRDAASWAELGDVPHAMSAGTLFPRHPAAPARIAALLRAGLARLDLAATSSAPPPSRSSPPPAVRSSVRAPVGPLGIAPIAVAPEPRRALDDPLVPLEVRIAELEACRATPRDRARAWLALSEAARAYQYSLVEAARCAREAATIDPTDKEALALAAITGAATGAPTHAHRHALLWADRAEAPDEQLRALALAVDTARRAQQPEDRIAALRRAVEVAPEDALVREQLAHALAEHGDEASAVEQARRAAELTRGGAHTRGRALLAWASQIIPTDLRTWNGLAKSFVRAGQSEVAVAILAQAARLQDDLEAREHLRLSALAFAELAGAADLASELLLEALEDGSALPEPLVTHLRTSGAWTEVAVIAAELAERSANPRERASLLLHAAEARIRLPRGQAAALALLRAAIDADPAFSAPHKVLAALAEELAQPHAVLDALELAIRRRCPDLAHTEQLDERTRREAVALLERLVRRLGEDHTAPLAAWAAELLATLEGHPMAIENVHALAEQRLRYEEKARKLETALRAAPAEARGEPGFRLALLRRHDPKRRGAAHKLLEKVLERAPDDARARVELEALTRLEGGETPIDDSPSEHEARVRDWRRALAQGDGDGVANALAALLAQAGDARSAARLGMRLSRAQTRAGKLDLAAGSAEAALARDPSSAEAALAVIEGAERIAAERRVHALRAARSVVGDLPELLRSLARACFAANDAEGQREALETLLALSPLDGFPARALVALQITGSDPRALRDALRAALDPCRFEPAALFVVERGLAQLAQLAGPDDAARLLIDATEQLGEQLKPLFGWAANLRTTLRDPALRILMVELLIAHAAASAQPPLLSELATLWRAQTSAWAEARALLRLLAIAPEDTDALERLAVIYRETHQVERLATTLEMLYERATTNDERRTRLLAQASCALYLVGDPSRAAALAKYALTLGDEPPSPEALREGIGLLRGAVPDRAVGVLLELAEQSSGPRAIALLEEARVIAEHDLEGRSRALEIATQSVLRHPDHEPFVDALERLAMADDALDPLLSTLETVAERCVDPERQAALFLRAGQLAEAEHADRARACSLYDRAYRATPTPEIEEWVIACAGRLFAEDARAGKVAFDRLRDTLHVRAKFGAPPSRARALLTLTRLAVDVYLSRDDAQRYAEACQTTLDASLASDPDDPELGAVQRELELQRTRLARALASLRPLQRASIPQPSFAPEPEPTRAPTLHSAPTLRPVTTPLSPSLTPPLALGPVARLVPSLASITPVDIRARTVTATLVPGLPDEPSPTPREPKRPAATARSDSDLVRAVARGETDALGPLAEHAQKDRARANALCSELLASVREQGATVCALRGLRALGAAASSHAVWRTSSQVLAFVEPPLRPPPGPRRTKAEKPLAQEALRAARATTEAPSLRLLSQLVEAAAPLFRRTGIRPDPARSALTEPPYATLLSELTKILGVRLEAFRTSEELDRVRLVSVQPATIELAARTTPELSSLRFRLARAYELARPENVLIATLEPERAETLMTALIAAFGPTAPAAVRVPRPAATLAADLWHTMPSGAQRTLSRMLNELPGPLVYASLVREVRLRAARAALFVARELDVALAQLGLDGDPAEARLERSEGALNRALVDQPLVRGLVSYALSEPYLSALMEQD